MQQQTARKLNTNPKRNQGYDVLEGKRNAKRERRINALRTGLFLGAATVICSLLITYYVSLQSEITSSIKTISRLESTLNTLKIDNDENYSRITGNVDLEEVRTVAIQELGMRYADEGQIITFNGEGSDYVRQTGSIPD